MKISQAECVEKVLKRFNMVNSKLVNVPLEGHFKLSKAQALTTEDENALMSEVPYESAVCNLIYVTVCTRSYITQAASIVNRYMSNPEKEHGGL